MSVSESVPTANSGAGPSLTTTPGGGAATGGQEKVLAGPTGLAWEGAGGGGIDEGSQLLACYPPPVRVPLAFREALVRGHRLGVVRVVPLRAVPGVEGGRGLPWDRDTAGPSFGRGRMMGTDQAAPGTLASPFPGNVTGPRQIWQDPGATPRGGMLGKPTWGGGQQLHLSICIKRGATAGQTAEGRRGVGIMWSAEREKYAGNMRKMRENKKNLNFLVLI